MFGDKVANSRIHTIESGWVAALLLGLMVLSVQVIPFLARPALGVGIFIISSVVFIAGLSLLAWARSWVTRLALVMVLLSLVIAPLTWTGLMAVNPSPEAALIFLEAGDLQGESLTGINLHLPDQQMHLLESGQRRDGGVHTMMPEA